MNTITIKQNITESLGSDESKLDFANSVIALLSGSEKPLSGIGSKLSEGLNSDLPEPMEGAPEFDSTGMSAQEFRRYSSVSAGYVPAGGKGLECGYSEYEYKHLTELSSSKLEYLHLSVATKIGQNTGKKKFVNFLKYILDIYYWFISNNIQSDN